MSRQAWTEALAWTDTDGTAVANTTTETILFPNVTIPANYMQYGRVLYSEYWGKFSVTATPGLRFRLRWGGVSGTVLADSGNITSASGVTNAIWGIRLRTQTRANGSSGSLFSIGQAVCYGAAAPTVGSATGAPGIAAMGNAGITAPVATTVDLTADTALAITITWTAASASNTITGTHLHHDSTN